MLLSTIHHGPSGAILFGDHSWVLQFVVVQLLSSVQLFGISWTAAEQTSLSLTIFQNLFKLMSIESLMPSNHLLLCHPLLLLPLIFPSIRVFSNESVLCIRWPKHWSFSFSISPSSEYSGLISLRIDWFGLLAVQKKGLTTVFSSTTVQKHQFFSLRLLYSPSLTSIHDYSKNHSFD